jgi:hypothetical protein
MTNNIEDDLEKALTSSNYRAMMNALGTFLSNVTGEAVKPKYGQKDFHEFRRVMTEAVKFAKEQEDLKQKALPQEFKKKQEMETVDRFLQIFGLGSVKDFVQQMVESMNPELFYSKYIDDPAYIKQKRESVHKILYELERIGSLDKVSQFNDAIGESAFEITQQATKLNDDMKYLLKERKRVSKVTIDNFLTIYKQTIAAFVESMITYLYGIQRITKGGFETYQSLRKIRMADQVKELRGDPLFRTFVESYRADVRNAVVHGGCYIQPATREICFTYKKIESMSYADFIKHVQEDLRNAIFIINLTHEITYLRFCAAQEKLNGSK